MTQEMNSISIREIKTKKKSFDVLLSFNNQHEYSCTIRDPFDEAIEELLDWYFETYLKFPFFEVEKAKRAKIAIQSYGEKLFDQVFKDRQIYSEYKRLVSLPLDQMTFEITPVSKRFDAIHWEMLKDPTLPNSFAVDGVHILRKNKTPIPRLVDSKDTSILNLLIVTSRPAEENDVAYRTISRPIIELLEKTNLRVRPFLLRPGTYQSLKDELSKQSEGFFQIIHFDVHGSLSSFSQLEEDSKQEKVYFNPRWNLIDVLPFEGKKSFLWFESDTKGKAVPVLSSEIASLLCIHRIPICFLNSCQSAKQANDAQSSLINTSLARDLSLAGVDMVVAMGWSVTVSAAKIFFEELYTSIFANRSPESAVTKGRKSLFDNKKRTAYFNQELELEDWHLPIVYQNRSVEIKIRELTSKELDAYYTSIHRQYTPNNEPYFGFIGRDLDILAIEKKLLKHPALLIRGMGGTGKSTLLEYLAVWWEKTGWVKKVFYFGYDQKSHTLEQIIQEIALKLLTEEDFIAFQVKNHVVQKGIVLDLLKTERYCVILDNCESISGDALSIENKLTQTEQTVLRDYLSKITKGKSYLLFGSRGEEKWLQPVTFKNNIHNLKGLDSESSTDLTKIILENNNIPIPNNDQAFFHLLDLLAGYPLALLVVLPNLKNMSAQQVLTSLKTGDTAIDSDLKNGKTTSILKCIEYSFSNLNPVVQRLMLLLAPFKGVIDIGGAIDFYLNYLEGTDLFKEFEFTKWGELIEASKNWGMLEPVEGQALVRMQPTLSFFLQEKFNSCIDENLQEKVFEAYRFYVNNICFWVEKSLKSPRKDHQDYYKNLLELHFQNIIFVIELTLQIQESIFLPFKLAIENYRFKNKFKEAVEFSQHVLDKLRSFPIEKQEELIDDFLLVKTFLGMSAMKVRAYAQAKNEFIECLELGENSHKIDPIAKKRGRANLLHHIGIIEIDEKHYSEARVRFNDALLLNLEVGFEYGQAINYHELGLIATVFQEYEVASNYFNLALNTHIAINTPSRELPTVYQSLGMVSISLGQFDIARKHLKKAIDIWTENDLVSEQAIAYQELALLEHQEGRFDAAKKNFMKSIEIKVSINAIYEQAISYRGLAILLKDMGDFEGAKDSLKKALEIYEQFQDQYWVAMIHYDFGGFYYEEGNKKAALSMFEKSKEMFSGLSDFDNIERAVRMIKRVKEKA